MDFILLESPVNFHHQSLLWHCYLQYIANSLFSDSELDHSTAKRHLKITQLLESL